MKFLVFLLVMVASAAIGYFFHPALYDWAEKNRSRVEVVTQTQTIIQNQTGGQPAMDANGNPTPATTAANTATSVASNASDLINRVQGKSEPKASDTMKSTNTASAGTEDEFDRKYPLPKFKEITEITKNWMWMPSKAFPRRIIAKQALTFVIPGGKAALPAGSEVSALAMDQGMVTVARSSSDSISAQLPLADTNLKELMSALYDAYTKKMVGRVMGMRQAMRDAKNRPAEPVVADDERVRLAGKQPVPDAEGRIPEIVAGILAKEISEIKLDNIVQWGGVGFEKSGGEGHWTASFTARLTTIFGEVDTDVTGWISKGKVTKWFYTGSKEPVN